MIAAKESQFTSLKPDSSPYTFSSLKENSG
jgi:hypothetical protein